MSNEPLNQQQLEEEARRMEAECWRLIWSGTEWLDAEAISARSARSIDLVRRQLEQWKRERRLIGLEKDGTQVFPFYEFANDFTPLPVISEIVDILQHHSDTWFAGWFESPSAFLGASRPRKLLQTRPDLVLAAARDAYEAEEYAG